MKLSSENVVSEKITGDDEKKTKRLLEIQVLNGSIYYKISLSKKKVLQLLKLITIERSKN